MTVSLVDLWLPIVLSAVAVWIAAALSWMVMPHHKGDYKKLENEDGVMAAMKQLKIPPGVYFFPHMAGCTKEMDEAGKAKFKEGPHGLLQIWPPDMFGKMGRSMVLSFVFYVIVGVLISLQAVATLHRGEDWHQVFHMTALAGIMSYCLASIPHAIWFGTPLRTVFACLVDGIVFGLITAGIFVWLWPGVSHNLPI